MKPNSIRVLPQQSERVETGALQFGDDWPGTFIRGDNAGYYSMMLGHLLDGVGNESEREFLTIQLRQLQRLLAGCVLGGAGEMLKEKASQ